MAPYRGRSQQTSPVADAKEVGDAGDRTLPRQFTKTIAPSALLLRRTQAASLPSIVRGLLKNTFGHDPAPAGCPSITKHAPF
jgi:hypothetical protein